MARSLIPLAALAAAPCAAAQAESVLQGRVLDPSGMRAAHVLVAARSVLSGAARQQETSVTGEFRRDETVPAGDLHLSLARVSAQTTVVSESRVAQLEEESPMPVTAVTKEQIRDTGYEQVARIRN